MGAISIHREHVALYESALEDYESGNYDGAIEKLTALGDFKESEKKLAEIKNEAYEKEVGFAKEAEERGEIEKALNYYEKANTYRDCKNDLARINILIAKEYEEKGELGNALSHFEEADTYGESKKDIARVTALIGNEHFESKEYEKALTYFEKAEGIDKLTGEDQENLLYCRAWPQNEKGVVALRDANEILSFFKYAKAIKDATEYEKLKTASLKAKEAVKNFEEAHELYGEFPGLAKRLDDSKKKRDSIDVTLAKLETDRAAEAEREARRAAAEAEKDARKLAATIRKDYGVTLERHYLDEGLDIRVSVYGPENTKIKLTYVLFSRVWAHEFAKGDIMTEMRNLGFKKVTLSDGYGEYWYWNLD